LLYAYCVVLFFRLKSAHRACGMGSSVGMRDGHANVQSTPCVIRDDGSSADCGEYCEVAGVYPQVSRIFVIAGVISADSIQS
jgi:hypothetical protein